MPFFLLKLDRLRPQARVSPIILPHNPAHLNSFLKKFSPPRLLSQPHKSVDSPPRCP